MFTGIVEGVASVTDVRPRKGDITISVDTGKVIDNPVIGESIAVEGVCLTVVKIKGAVLDFDVSKETLNRTTLANIKRGGKVNLERAMRVGGRLGGHLVSGHIDTTATVKQVISSGDGYTLEVNIERAGMKYIIGKGSIALSGVSLTVAEKKKESITVALIPHTWKETTLCLCKPGSALNVEYDMIAKYVENFALPEAGGVNRDFLSRHGFA